MVFLLGTSSYEGGGKEDLIEELPVSNPERPISSVFCWIWIWLLKGMSWIEWDSDVLIPYFRWELWAFWNLEYITPWEHKSK